MNQRSLEIWNSMAWGTSFEPYDLQAHRSHLFRQNGTCETHTDTNDIYFLQFLRHSFLVLSGCGIHVHITFADSHRLTMEVHAMLVYRVVEIRIRAGKAEHPP